MQRKKAPIHLYIPTEGFEHRQPWKRGELGAEGIDALWMERGEGKTQGAGAAIPESDGEGSVHDLPIIHRVMSQSAIEHVTGLSPAGIAIEPRATDILIKHGISAGIKHTPLYIMSRPHSPNILWMA